ncbi:hypothetical protein N9413_12060 [Paracoccaceae bacterium]|nr:hypothetical protein [Paracoccaceae bacterium]
MKDWRVGAAAGHVSGVSGASGGGCGVLIGLPCPVCVPKFAIGQCLVPPMDRADQAGRQAGVATGKHLRQLLLGDSSL